MTAARIEDLSAEDLQQIFVPFKKGDAHVVRFADAGVGLGLPIVKVLVELMGGNITIASTLGTGTRVTVYLPQEARGVKEAG